MHLHLPMLENGNLTLYGCMVMCLFVPDRSRIPLKHQNCKLQICWSHFPHESRRVVALWRRWSTKRCIGRFFRILPSTDDPLDSVGCLYAAYDVAYSAVCSVQGCSHKSLKAINCATCQRPSEQPNQCKFSLFGSRFYSSDKVASALKQTDSQVFGSVNTSPL